MFSGRARFLRPLRLPYVATLQRQVAKTSPLGGCPWRGAVTFLSAGHAYPARILSLKRVHDKMTENIRHVTDYRRRKV